MAKYILRVTVSTDAKVTKKAIRDWAAGAFASDDVNGHPTQIGEAQVTSVKVSPNIDEQ